MVEEKMGNVTINDPSSAEQPEPSIADIELEGLRFQAAGEFHAAVKNFRIIHERENSGVSLSRYCRALAIAGDVDELNRVALSADLRNFNSSPWTYLHDLSAAERRILLEVLMIVCQSPEAIVSLCRAVQYIIENDIRGDFVECGVYKGASAICIIRMLQEFGIHDRRVWLYDTFAGMPKPEAVDRYCDAIGVQEDPDAMWTRLKRDDGSGGSDWVYCSFDDVKKNVIRTGYPQESIIFIKGMIEETIPSSAPERISLLRLDTDFYRSTHHELVHLYPRLVPGGVLIIDDYGAFQGAREATDEYIRQNNLRLFLSRIDEHVRLAIKP